MDGWMDGWIQPPRSRADITSGKTSVGPKVPRPVMPVMDTTRPVWSISLVNLVNKSEILQTPTDQSPDR